MRSLITGATGFVGRRLLASLPHPVVLTRDPDRARRTLGSAADIYPWDPVTAPPPPGAFQGVDAIFHLAGEPIAGGRWTASRKARIRDSRILGTRHLVQALAGLTERPQVLVAASAVGYYADRGDETLDETSAPGEDWLAQLCRDWEAEAARAAPLGLRVVHARLGIVLGDDGGALARMLPPFRLGLGGPLASGRQWMSWIHRDDLVGLLLHAARRPDLSGPLNAVGPQPVTNREFTRTLAAALHRPAVFPVPALALRLLFGEMSTVLLGSQRVRPRVAEATGYSYRHPTLESALRAILTVRER